MINCFRTSFLLCYLLLSVSFLELNAKSVRINASCSLAKQMVISDTKYIIASSIDLKGQTISIPENSELVIKRGTISNGVIVGNNSYITLRRNSLDNVSIGDGVISTTKTVKSSYYKSNGYELLESLCNICPNDGIALLDKDVEYTINRPITVKQSITLKGKKHVLKLKNPDNCAITSFEAICLSHFVLCDLIIDGAWDSSRGHGKYTDQYLMNIRGVETVTIKNCVFKNAMVILPSWQEREVAMILISDYHKLLFDSNTITNCYVDEGLTIRNDDDMKGIATITNNLFDYRHTSSCLNAAYGRYIIKNNVFGTCRGSAINVFGFDSQIVGNTFLGSYYSCAIDLSEIGYFNYLSHDILISKNTAYFCYDGFLNGYGISNITIRDNIINSTVVKQEDIMKNYEGGSTKPQRGRVTDIVLVLAGPLKNINIEGNFFLGGRCLLSMCDDAKRENITITKNRIELDKTTFRSSIVFNSVDGLLIKGNVFVGAGCTPGYLNKPVFIATLPVRELNSKVSNVAIKENQFHSKSDSCFVFTQSVYDRNMDIYFLELNNIIIENNKSNVPASLVFVNKYFSESAASGIKVKNNDFKGGSVMANNIIETDMGQKNLNHYSKNKVRGEVYIMNTVVEMGGKYYYVVAGGKASESEFSQDKDFLRNGVVVLREMK